jgi:class 3 adenylate cyclase
MIKWRFFKSFIVIITFFILAVSLIAGKFLYDAFVTETLVKAKTVTRSFSVLFPVIREQNDPLLFQKYLKDFSKIHNVEYLYAADFDGHLLGFYSKHPDKEKILRYMPAKIDRPQIVIKNLKLRDTNIIQASLPVQNMDKDSHFFIAAGYSKEQFEEDILAILKFTSIIFLIFITIGFFVSLNTASYLSKPIVKLTDNVMEIGKGKHEQVESLNTRDELETLGQEINKMIEGLKERELLKNTFQRYVTKEVAEELLSDPSNLELGGIEREASVIFSDIRDFTKLCETMTASETMSFLNEYLKEMLDIVYKNQGTLDKFIGDSIMVLFGAPKPRADDTMRAVMTALEMQERLAQVNEQRVVQGKVEIHIGIGINTGKVIAGNIGDQRRMEYTVIGHNVNLASRLEQLTKKYGSNIIISESTYMKVKDAVEARELGKVSIKGVELPIIVYELIGLK